MPTGFCRLLLLYSRRLKQKYALLCLLSFAYCYLQVKTLTSTGAVVRRSLRSIYSETRTSEQEQFELKGVLRSNGSQTSFVVGELLHPLALFLCGTPAKTLFPEILLVLNFNLH